MIIYFAVITCSLKLRRSYYKMLLNVSHTIQCVFSRMSWYTLAVILSTLVTIHASQGPEKFTLATAIVLKRGEDITWSVSRENLKYNYRTVVDTTSKAFAVWHTAGLNFRFVHNYSQAMIRISFKRRFHGEIGYDFDGLGSLLAHAYLPNQGDLSSEIHLDNDEIFSFSMKDSDYEGDNAPTSYFWTVLHEIGHSLGVQHSSLPSSIMYGWYKSRSFGNGTIVLPKDDANAINQLYFSNTKQYATIPNFDKNKVVTTTPVPPADKSESTANTTITTCFSFDSLSEIKHDATKDSISAYCAGVYDAISYVRGELYVFVGDLHWRFDTSGMLHNGYPQPTGATWRLPSGSQVNAVFEWMQYIVIQTGKRYNLFVGTDFVRSVNFEVAPSITFSSNNRVYAAFRGKIKDITGLLVRRKNLRWRYLPPIQLLQNELRAATDILVASNGMYIFKSGVHGIVVNGVVEHYKLNKGVWSNCR
ncbi:zinc-dependent metalloprotease [Heliothis virescens ascovirus 3h]|uniref:Zinc-dependent metalloprotease n=1 Tax=Heliothis virescens ascovirus 3h TaxID=1268039 RepID=A0A386JAA0_9VIRU|nr:zinc-dependent metalloprotease [Heliothis virescens ascovirus 3h]